MEIRRRNNYRRYNIVAALIIIAIWIAIIGIYHRYNTQLNKISEEESNTKVEKVVHVEKTNSVPNDVPKEEDQTIKTIIADGFSIYITTENIAQVYYEGKFKSVRATFRRNAKEIRIENREVAIFESVEHEFGHYLDFLNGDTSWSEEFGQIYEEESEEFKTRISNPGCVSNQGEFFAETFYYIIKDPSKCTPKAKAYVQKYIDELNNIPVEEGDQYGCSFFIGNLYETHIL